MERYDAGKSGVTLKEAKELVWTGIFAAVDTTSGKMGWSVIHAALNPELQQKLYEEVASAVALNGGKLTVESLERSNDPFLHAFLRE